MFYVLIQRRPIHAVLLGEVQKIKISGFASSRRGFSIERGQIAWHESGFIFFQKAFEHFPGFVEVCAVRVNGHAQKTQFRNGANRQLFSTNPLRRTVM